MKRIISLLLSIVIITTISLEHLSTYADDELLASYTGTTTASYGYNPTCTFRIDKIVDNNFRGSFAASNLGIYSFDKTVSGSVCFGEDSFTCCFTVLFFNNQYYSDICVTVYPLEGCAECTCSGSWHMENFEMTGTIFDYSDQLGKISNLYNSYNEDDMRTCMNLSYSAYFDFDEMDTSIGYSILENKKYIVILTTDFINTCINHELETDNIFTKNYPDTDPNNVAFSITYRKPKGNSNIVDMFVVIRGTLDDEWQGNAQITGSSYNESSTHLNFSLAKDSIKEYINKYYNTLKETYDDVNLIITGHSRGAAIANLYAKEATDGNSGVPDFNSVTAYTFACPSVAKNDYANTMESYTNIFNFCFSEDLVPTVPLTNPTEGWNYWKYGKTFCSTLSGSLIPHKSVSKKAINRVHKGFKYWKTVEDYYNMELKGVFGSSTTLYDTIYDLLGRFKSQSGYSQYIAKQNILNRIGTYPKLAPLICGAIFSNFWYIGHAHEQETYNSIINFSGSATFNEYTYNDCITDSRFPFATTTNNKSKNVVFRISSTQYDQSEKAKLISLYNQSNNSELLDWNIDEPSTWTGITWNLSGNVVEINLPYLDLEGSLNLSDFSALENVDVSGNRLMEINVSNCTALTYLNISANSLTYLDVSDCIDLETLDCSFNDLSTDGLDVSANTALTSLTCDDCGLTTLNVSNLTALEELSCAFNELTTINVDNNTALTSLTCCYNYMDTHEGGTLYNKFDDLLFSDVYVNYYPQAVPENASFNTSELNALKTFALTENNNDALDWLDENDNIDTDKLQNNALFEYDGSAYRVVAFDVADTEVEGALNLTALSFVVIL